MFDGHVYLTGLPGSGKTTLGKMAAQRLGRPFYDLDAMIEERAGMDVAEIFSRFGEPRFRALESDMLLEVEKLASGVVATGGGLPMQKQNERALREGFVIFVDRPPQEIEKTLNMGPRPLLTDIGRLYALSRQRRATYLRLAHAVIAAPDLATGVREIEGALVRAAARREDVRSGPVRLAVVGDPIGHSLSPMLHNTIYRLMDIDAVYEAVRLPKGGLGALAEFSPPIFGCNLTMPHKQDAAKLYKTVPEGLDSVNTIRFGHDGSALATSTDAHGFIRGMLERGVSAQGASIVLLGAGGAAYPIGAALLTGGCKRLSIFNRTLGRAQSLAQTLAVESGLSGSIGAYPMDGPELFTECERADILINSTSCGMQGAADFESLAFVDALPKGAFVSDLVYRPAQTPLLKAAGARGLNCQNGLSMLLYQGILAHEFFFGGEVPADVISKVMDRLAAGGSSFCLSN